MKDRDEQFIYPDSVKGIGALYKMRDDLKKRIEKNPEDWTAKHLLESVSDKIKNKRQEMYKRENEI